MSKRIPQDFLDQLLTRIDIVELIDDAIPLKKMGSNLSACCPFHQEKTPSFTVSPSKQFYHCFGCGAHGNAIGFLIEHERLTFLEAVELLAKKTGLEIPKTAMSHQPQSNNITVIYDILTVAEQFYYQQLSKHPVAIDYLKNRQISGQTAKDFCLGFAPPGWDNLLTLCHQKGFDEALLLRAGLIIKKEGKCYDRFRNRIVFPIRDRRGRTIGFGGRVLDDSLPKYLNSPETPVFQKRQELYGLYEARRKHQKLPQVLIVEGYMDVVALADKGIHYAAATLGTATSSHHLRTLCRQTHNIIFCFDGDKAGLDAAWRALETALPLMQDDMNIRFLFLPENEDPDSMVKQEGRAAFEKRMATSTTLATHFLDTLCRDVDLTSLDGRASLTKTASKHIDHIPNGVFKHMLLHDLSKIVRMDKSELQTFIAPTPKAPTLGKTKTSSRPPSTMRHALSLLIQHPHLWATAPQNLPTFTLPGGALFSKLCTIIKQAPALNTGAIIERFRESPEASQLSALATTTLTVPSTGIEAEFHDTLMRLMAQQREQTIDGLMARAATHTGLTLEEKQHLKQLISDKND